MTCKPTALAFRGLIIHKGAQYRNAALQAMYTPLHIVRIFNVHSHVIRELAAELDELLGDRPTTSFDAQVLASIKKS